MTFRQAWKIVEFVTAGEIEANKGAAQSLKEGYYCRSESIKADAEATAEDLDANCLVGCRNSSGCKPSLSRRMVV